MRWVSPNTNSTSPWSHAVQRHVHPARVSPFFLFSFVSFSVFFFFFFSFVHAWGFVKRHAEGELRGCVLGGWTDRKKSKSNAVNGPRQIRLLSADQIAGTPGKRGDQTKDGVVRVALDDDHVQAVEALAQNGHDAGGDLAKIGILRRQCPLERV